VTNPGKNFLMKFASTREAFVPEKLAQGSKKPGRPLKGAPACKEFRNLRPIYD
jgi:hypothetical protein